MSVHLDHASTRKSVNAGAILWRLAVSQKKRKLGEEPFGWAKTIAGIAKVKAHGLARLRHQFTIAMTAYNLIRMPKLTASAE